MLQLIKLIINAFIHNNNYYTQFFLVQICSILKRA